MALKFMLVGIPKSGSKTIHKALGSAGLQSLHGRMYAKAAEEAWREGDDPMRDLPDVDAITELIRIRGKWNFHPQLIREFLVELRRRHPVAFLLNTRDLDDLIDSIDRWGDSRRRWIRAEIPFSPSGHGRSRDEMKEWITAHYNMIRETFGDDPLFRECDIADPRMPGVIEDMIDRPLGWWGVANANPDGRKR